MKKRKPPLDLVRRAAAARASAASASYIYQPTRAAEWGTQPHSIFWAEDPDWAAPAPNAAVSTWRNAGSNTTAAVQATGSLQPLFRASGINGRPSIQGDGVDDLLRQAAFTSIPQPFSIVVVGALSSNAAAAKFVVDSIVAAEAAIYSPAANGFFQLFAGVGFASSVAFNTNTHLFRGYFNGASSVLGVDETNTTGNGGTSAITGMTIGSSFTGGTAGTAGHISLVILYPGNIAADVGWTRFKAWVRSHYGLTIA